MCAAGALNNRGEGQDRRGHHRDAELVFAREAWRDPIVVAHYRTHRPMVERTIAWLVAHGNRCVRYRGVERNQQWLATRLAAINLRRLLNLGLNRQADSWDIV